MNQQLSQFGATEAQGRAKTRQQSIHQSMRGRQSLTTQILDRYIFCLNTVQEKRFIPIIDLKKEIKRDLEANRNFLIDKKTVKRIIMILKAEGLVATKDIRVTISYADMDSDSGEILQGGDDSEGGDFGGLRSRGNQI